MKFVYATGMTLEVFRADRAAAKRHAVMDAAEGLFCEDGYVRTNMERVARRADVSTATLYRYFASKEALFDAVANRALSQLQLDIGAEKRDFNNLDAIARAYATFLSRPKTRSLFRMIVAECGRNNDLAERFYAAFKNQLSALFIDAVEKELPEKSRHNDRDSAHIAGQLQGMIEHSTIMRGLVRGDSIGTATEAAAIASSALETWRARWTKS